MFTLVSCVIASQVLGTGHDTLLTPLHQAGDVRSLSTGADAVGHDPAAVMTEEGFALQYRHRLQRGVRGAGRFGAYALMPLFDRVGISAGYEWQTDEGARFGRATVGLAGKLSQRLMFGAAFRGISSKHDELSTWFLDVGFHSQVASWLSLSAGVDGLNGPKFLGGRMRPDYVFGTSFRPIAGEPWLSVGTEVRLGAGVIGPYRFRLARAMADIRPIEGLSILAAYRHVDNRRLPQDARLSMQRPGHEIWVGLGFRLTGVEGRVSSVVYNNRSNERAESGAFADTAIALTVRDEQAESLVTPGGRLIEVLVRGDLMPRRDGVLATSPYVSGLAWQVARLAEDSSVSVVRFSVGSLSVGLAQVEELRGAILQLRKAGIHTVADISNADDKAYLVASACDEIRMEPVGSLQLDGFETTQRYFADTLQKVGIRFDAVAIGAYKTAPDTFTRSHGRAESKEVAQSLLDEAGRLLLDALAQRGISQDKADLLITQGIFTAEEAKEAGLIDGLTAPSDPLAPTFNEPFGEPLVAASMPRRKWGERPVIAVVPVIGTIVAGPGDNPLPGATAAASEILPMLSDAMRDSDVVAVVLRVDSPGGDVLASDLLWRAVRSVAAVKPVVVSMGDVAASGGYYVSAGATRILAQANTITGSIGIFSVKPDVSGLLNWLAVGSESQRTHARAGWDKIDRPLGDKDREVAKAHLKSHYDAFVARVAAGRRLTIEEADERAQGRVYTGRAARDLGLVDRIGGLVEAIDEARRLGGLDDDDAFELGLPDRPRSLSGMIGLPSMGVRLEGALDLVEDLESRLSVLSSHPWALAPFAFELR